MSQFYNPVLFSSCDGDYVYGRPETVLATSRATDVMPLLQQVDLWTARGGYAAGFVAYEAASAFDHALETHPPQDGLPLLWFALYRDPAVFRPADSHREGEFPADWQARVPRRDYDAALDRIRKYIAAGDTYQVNYTFPMETVFDGDPRAWYRRLCAAQGARYAAFIDTGDHAVLSVSPELFFRRDGNQLHTRPMKGTRPRGLYPGSDRALREELRASIKDRAENVMIVDMLRNDLGRICRFGSVTVDDLFSIERYETVWQMTSGVSGLSDASLPQVFQALFPCASVTGAPKVRTMQIIRELEPFARGVYCGAVGWCGPDTAQFNVAIRTVVLDKRSRRARCSVGGAVVWDSTTDGEYDECRTKASFLTRSTPDFQLIESLLWNGAYSCRLEHLKRLAQSMEYFGFRGDIDGIAKQLDEKASGFPEGPRKVRLLVGRDGGIHIESAPTGTLGVLRVGLAREPVDEKDIFLYHKTTFRAPYDRARALRPDLDDVLLWNSNGELTESTIANVVVRVQGEWVTPPVECGLLAGTFRAKLLDAGVLREEVVRREDLKRAEALCLINSVRGWIDVEMSDETFASGA